MAKPIKSAYTAGRIWFKVRRTQTTEAIVGGVTSTLRRPQLLILGQYDADGRLRAAGRTAPLKPEAVPSSPTTFPRPALTISLDRRTVHRHPAQP
ncbi:hypothetical protein ACFY3G_46215 [Streptomyces phaeochromogenes]|uniref:hypothetical protein n=1 Tax=Streptomyces phaeochromogenes TaxID=1923 RepID=UPI0036BE4740